MKYAVLFEPTATGYSAHVPDLPGCVAAAATLEETAELIRGPSVCIWLGWRKTGSRFRNPAQSHWISLPRKETN